MSPKAAGGSRLRPDKIEAQPTTAVEDPARVQLPLEDRGGFPGALSEMLLRFPTASRHRYEPAVIFARRNVLGEDIVYLRVGFQPAQAQVSKPFLAIEMGSQQHPFEGD